MKLWMAVMRDLELLMNDHERILDAWAEGGVEALAIGPLAFQASAPSARGGCRRTTSPTASPWPPKRKKAPRSRCSTRIRRCTSASASSRPRPRSRPCRNSEPCSTRTLHAARDRGLSVYIIYADSGAGPGGDGHHFEDEKSMRARLARAVDTLEQFPAADGAIMDGPEWGYEIAPHHMNRRSFIFDDLPESTAPLCERLGYDYAALAAARDRLFDLLHDLDSKRVRLHGAGGLLGGYHLLGADPGLMAWMNFRVDSLTAFFRFMREGLASELSRPLEVGVGPRSPAFAPLCGYDAVRLAGFMDFLLPKFYFWHRGFDGFVGTVHRYVETLCEWNPGLETGDALKVVQALFGILLPGVRETGDFEIGPGPGVLPGDRHCRDGAGGRRGVGDARRIVPWVETGRHPHDGDPMSGGGSAAAAGSGSGGRPAAVPVPPHGPPDPRRVDGDQRDLRHPLEPAHQLIPARGHAGDVGCWGKIAVTDSSRFQPRAPRGV